jgi:hypothetical protein
MSYLNAMRLHFAGQFQGNPSTVNNDPEHFRNSTFQPNFQKLSDGADWNGWFNPQGDGGFRLLGCHVTSAWTAAGPVSTGDPILAALIADSGIQVCGKLVDLDPMQQLVSEIWGLQFRITDGTGASLMTGDFLEAPFTDIWDRAIGSIGGDADGGAAYQSVLRNLVWGDVPKYPFLTQLKTQVEDQAVAGGEALLSVKFNLDGINLNFQSPNFMCGRIVGTIGPATSSEPKHMLIGRHFMASSSHLPGKNFFFPAGGINFCTAVLDPTTNNLLIDLGNALPTTVPGGPMYDLGDLTVYAAQQPSQPPVLLGSIPSRGPNGYASKPDWYEGCGGIATLPLNAQQLSAIAGMPLYISAAATPFTQIAEASGGGYLRADKYVYRVSPGETAKIAFYAMQWGQPLAGAQIDFAQDPSQLQAGAPTPAEQPSPAYLNVATPSEAITIDMPSVMTDENGIAVLTIDASDPRQPRWAGPGDFGLDGQVYGVRASFHFDPSTSANNPVTPFDAVNQWDFVSILLWTEFKTSHPVQWSEIQPVLQQYANLYPVMNRFLNLSDLDSVKKNLRLLKLAFGLDPTDPNSMPVARDLSKQKRAAILSWLANPVGGPTPPSPPAAAISDTAKPSTQQAFATMSRGGKTLAAARRLVRQGAKA